MLFGTLFPSKFYLVIVSYLLLTACHSPKPSYQKSEIKEGSIDFNLHVKPILSDRCFACHGPDANKREADLRLDTPEGAFSALAENKGHAIVPGKPRDSEVYRRIVSQDPETVMPPPKSNLGLSEKEVAIIAQWIAEGAEYKPHWSFTAPTEPTIPDPSAHPIDYFIDRKLADKGLLPTSKANKALLLRRLSFDITGLPPTVDELDQFLADTSIEAYSKEVERLLSSTAYGERMATYWLDVARYADTHGYQFDFEREVWPWRDWVIQSFNQNMPYNQFVTWQLAGDLLPDPTQEQIIATAFNRNHPQNPEGGIIPEEYRVEYVADRTNTLGKAFLGLTLECARCHDHKYDPLSQKEYYEVFSFFNNVDEAGQISFFTRGEAAPTLLLTDKEAEEQIEFLTNQLLMQVKKLDSIQKSDSSNFLNWLANRPTSADLQDGLLAHLPMDRVQKNSLINLAEKDNPAELFDQPELVKGANGSGLQLNGENGVNIKTGDFYRSDPFTISISIKPEKLTTRAVIWHRSRGALDAASRGYELTLDSGKVVAALNHNWPYNAIKIRTKKPVQPQQWSHLAMTYDGSSRASGLKIYVNGILSTTDIIKDNLYKGIRYTNNKLPLQLGARFRDSGFKNGSIDELMVFDRKLTAPEVLSLVGNDSIFFKPTAALTPNEVEQLHEYFSENVSPSYRKQTKRLTTYRRILNNTIEDVKEIMVMDEMDNPRPTYLLERGGYDNHGERVFPSTPGKILAFEDRFPSNRLGLAQWLFDKNNPLTARVMVNRLWHLFFGNGIVSSLDDFGNQGALPTHPELLNWLAIEFRESGWNMKHMIRLMVSSKAYQRSTVAPTELKEKDPDNMWLAYGAKHRLTAEMIRDHSLASSGLLNRKLGGPPVKPYQPEGLWKEKKADMVYIPSKDGDLFRRSLYTFWKRTSPPPNMITFDASERNVCIVKREATATPLQSLVLLNDPQFVEASRVLAEHLVNKVEGQDRDKIIYAFRSLTSRKPRPEELDVLVDTYNEQLMYYQQRPHEADKLLQVGETELFNSVEREKLAAYTMLTSTIMNFEDTYLKY